MHKAHTPTELESDCSSFSYSPDFKNFIIENENESKLFFLRVLPNVEQKNNIQIVYHSNNENLFRNEYKRMSLRRDKGGILSKFSGRKKKSMFEWTILDKHKYEHADGVLKEFRIGSATKGRNITKKNLEKHGTDLFATIFNASLLLGPDNKRFLIEKINEGSVFEHDLNVGDIIKSIDGEIITIDNFNRVLKRIHNQKSFKIVAHECFNEEFANASMDEVKITKLTDIVLNKKKLFELNGENHELVFSLNLISRSDQDFDDFTTIFSYPPRENNFLHKLKGSFLTISSIMKSSSLGSPVLTSIKVHDTNFFVSYSERSNDKQFIFIGFNSNYSKQIHAHQQATNLVKFLDFTYPDIMDIRDSQHLSVICETIKIQMMKDSVENVKFEGLFSCSIHVPLPKEIVLRINDSLSELEAMDYRNWDETLMELFGKFNVIGSCLFYKTSLVCSHYNEVDMENVELFLRSSGLKLLYENCFHIREIAMWQRVYPKNYQSFNAKNDSSKNKVFLLVAAHGNLMMSVMLEENGYNTKVEMQSSNYLIYFLEEMDDILDHLKFVGIENLTRIWIQSAKRPQCKNLEKGKEVLVTSPAEPLKSLKEEEEGSEHDFDSQIDSQKSSSGFDMNDFSDTFYKDFTDIIPQTLTFGHNENVLYHYTQLDVAEGIIITTINEQSQNEKDDVLVDVFRRGCLKIHHMLQNTIRFNQMLSKEHVKISHKSTLLMPIEKGILVHLKTTSGEFEFWIVGRYCIVGKKELFVCYDAKIPQNMVELAFRIGLNTVG